MNEKPTLCNCGCGRTVKHPFARYIKGHKGKDNVQGRNDRLDARCGFCDSPIKVERWRIEKFGADNVYCSVNHAAQKRAQDANKKFVCEYCEKEFSIKQSKKQGDHVFCSLSCSTRFKWDKKFPPVIVACETCRKEFRVPPSKAKKNKHFYCSVECRSLHITGANNPAYRSGTGRHPYYGGNWRKQRRIAIQRDGGICQHCGKKPKKQRYLEVHHITPAYTFGDNHDAANELSNLICLCSTCHKKAERGLIPIAPRLL